MSRPGCRRSPARFAFAGRGWSLPVSRLRGTILEGQFHKECVMNPAAVQTNGVRSAVDSCRCRFRHRGGSMPALRVRCATGRKVRTTYPHSSVKGSCNIIVLFQPGTASENFRKPKRSDSTLHMANLSLRGSWRLHPLRRLSSNTAYHVCMGQCLWSPRALLDVQR